MYWIIVKSLYVQVYLKIYLGECREKNKVNCFKIVMNSTFKPIKSRHHAKSTTPKCVIYCDFYNM